MLIPVLPPPGINSDDSPFTAQGRWADGDGFRFRAGRAETIGGSAEMTEATVVDVATKMLVYDAGGTITLAVAGTTLVAGAPDAPGTDISPASGWTNAPSHRRCLHMFGDVLLASIGGGRLFESSGGAQAVEVANAPDQITCMIVTPSRQVMALGCNEEASGLFNGRCIRWSDIEDHQDWATSAANNAGEYVLPGQADIVGGCVLGDNILVWTESDMWLAQYYGDPGQTYIFTRVGDIGIAGLDAWAIYRQTAYWMGPDRGVYAYQVGGPVQRVPCPMSTQFAFPDAFGNAKIFACAVPRFGEIWFSLPVQGTVPTHYFVYGVDESIAAQAPVWFRGTFSLAADYPGAMVDSPLLIDSPASQGTTTLIHAYAGRPWRWDCAASPTGYRFAIAGAFIQTADFYLDGGQRRLMLRSVSPDFDEQHGAALLTLHMRDRPLAEPRTKGPYLLATSTELSTAIGPGIPVPFGATSLVVGFTRAAMAAGVKFNFIDVNAWDDGDTGSLKEFTVASDFLGGNGTLHFTPAVFDSGPDRNVVSLPPHHARVVALTRASKKDFRASGRVMALRFTTAAALRLRLGKPVFDAIACGER